MDILTHTLSGMAIGTVICSFSRQGFWDRTKIVMASTIGGAFPDIDAISLWSQFDSTIGKFLHFKHSGRDIYFGKFWYSHHAFFHSLAGAISVGLIGWFILYLIKNRFREVQLSKIKTALFQRTLGPIGFVSGYTIHLFEDMPTPSGSWGGVNFFWPSEKYIGGTADIWWWNNYDIFLMALLVIVINSLFHFVRRFVVYNHKVILISVFILALSICFHQIKTRSTYQIAHSKNPVNHLTEAGSLSIQQDILGERCYQIMTAFDSSIALNF
jgi:inner membrane protein